MNIEWVNMTHAQLKERLRKTKKWVMKRKREGLRVSDQIAIHYLWTFEKKKQLKKVHYLLYNFVSYRYAFTSAYPSYMYKYTHVYIVPYHSKCLMHLSLSCTESAKMRVHDSFESSNQILSEKTRYHQF